MKWRRLLGFTGFCKDDTGLHEISVGFAGLLLVFEKSSKEPIEKEKRPSGYRVVPSFFPMKWRRLLGFTGFCKDDTGFR